MGRRRAAKGENDTRACTRFHRAGWHFINYFWEGISGATDERRPRDRTDIRIPEVNIVERLGLFRPLACCSAPGCGMLPEERATTLAWVLHLVGDVHQPLHTAARVTALCGEHEGDRGGNLFELDEAEPFPLTLHSYWDGIIDRTIAREQDESRPAYLDRVAALIVARHPPEPMSGRLLSGDFAAWSREGFATTKQEIYPASLRRRHLPSDEYQARARALAQEAIALGGYRLADLLNRMFGP